VPFTINPGDAELFKEGAAVQILNLREQIKEGKREVQARLEPEGRDITLFLHDMTDSERRILLNGCLMNDYRKLQIL
jgi:hypothetical protein